MTDPIRNPVPARSASSVDARALDKLLDIGGADLRAALCVQLTEDFSRLSAALDDDCTQTVANASHELKGLAATVGAERLTDMVSTFDGGVQTLPREARKVMVGAVQREIGAVLDLLAGARQGPKRA
ncbi:MAG: Hpt domain-containing protein [Rhodobacteraceae bacterium]|nr:Hpt domain-containing protein [Paracoccaceae bacterium]